MNTNIIFFINFCWLLGMLLATTRIIYLRSKRDSLKVKYKNTPRAKEVEQILSTSRLIFALTLSLLVALFTIYATSEIFKEYDDKALGQLLFLSSFGVVLCGTTAVLGYRYLDSRKLIIKP